MSMKRIDINCTSSSAAGYNRQGTCAMLRGSYREASFYLLAAVVSDPDYWPAFFNLGNSWAKLGENEAAIWSFEQAVRNCDHHAPLFLNLGILLCREGRFSEALPYLKQSYRLNPQGLSQSVALGYVSYRLRLYSISWYWYREANRLAPNNKKIRDSLTLAEEKFLASRNKA